MATVGRYVKMSAQAGEGDALATESQEVLDASLAGQPLGGVGLPG